MPQKLKEGSYKLTSCPHITAYASVVGKKEGEGPLGKFFDVVHKDTSLGEETWEKAESKLQKDAVNMALKRGDTTPQEVDLLFSGDLLNQCVGSSFGLRELDIPFLGIYGACSTMAEGLAISSLLLDGGGMSKVMAVTSSHFCSAERQFRFPLEYGGQRTPTAQWTVTGAGAVLLEASQQAPKPPYIKGVCIGKIQDLGIKDINNMGAAMAPAAADTIKRYLTDMNKTPNDYDMIVTGDLGFVGSELLYDLLNREGIDIKSKHKDCGKMIFDRHSQDVHAGGSGCGCAASVLCGYLLKQVEQGALKNILFTATGALMSTLTMQQGETIPSIAHLVEIGYSKD